MLRRKRFWLALVLLVFVGWTYSWTYTPYGRLDYRAAFSLKLLSFETEYQPVPEMDFSFNLPVNLIYAASALLPAHKVADTRDLAIPGEVDIPARLYTPEGEAPAGGWPLIVYYHGGGFVVGSVEIFDPLTRELSAEAGVQVLSVDYRLAPKDPYPAAINDAYAALVWAEQNASTLGANPAQLMVGGDSAGGNIAAVMALMTRDQQGPNIIGQILYYPAVDVSGGLLSASGPNFADGYGLSTEAMLAFRTAYYGDRDPHGDPYLSPILAESVADLAPALVVTAGFDPLTETAQQYSQRMIDSGVDVTEAHFSDMIHGFMSIGLFPQQDEAMAQTVAFVNSVK